MGPPILLLMAGLGLATATTASALAAQDPMLRMAEAECLRLVRHQPADDVAYRPGVDSHGRAVVPAEPDNLVQIETPEEFLIPIKTDLAERLGIPAGLDGLQADAFVGEIEVRGGRAYFNGQPLQDETEAELATLCREATGQAR